MNPHPLIDSALDLLTANYVFPDRAREIAAHVRSRMADGAYDDLTDQALCETVTADLQAHHHDRHLRLLWHEEPRRRAPTRPRPRRR